MTKSGAEIKVPATIDNSVFDLDLYDKKYKLDNMILTNFNLLECKISHSVAGLTCEARCSRVWKINVETWKVGTSLICILVLVQATSSRNNQVCFFPQKSH